MSAPSCTQASLRPVVSRWGVWLLSLATLLVACGPSAGRREISEGVTEGLRKLSLEQVVALGSHHSESTLVLASESEGAKKVITERYQLHWDNWQQYHYLVRKGELTVMDVTLWQGKAFQMQLDGHVRVRTNLDEIHYYLRQTWNQWETAADPFRGMLVFEANGKEDLEGRAVERFRITLKPNIEPQPGRSARVRESVEHDQGEGLLVVDKLTGVPLRLDFHGAYRLVRFSRRPGKPGEEARFTIDFKLRRDAIGQPQVTAPPEVVARP